jgi:hypothetical protein
MSKCNCPLCNGTGKIKQEEVEINQYGQKRVIISKKIVQVGDFFLIARVMKTSRYRNPNLYTQPMPRAKFVRKTEVCNPCKKSLC